MMCKFVYTLVSNGEDCYTEQLAISAYSLKYYNPSAKIILVTDQRTLDDIRLHKMDNLLNDINEVIVAKTEPTSNGMQRSREIKTSIRNIVDGDFLFIDTDTIIAGKFNNACDLEDIVIGAVYDGHYEKVPSSFNEKEKTVMDAMKWNIDKLANYFNSGIIYVKDCQKSRDFYKRWNDNWKKTKELGFNYDQLSLAFTNIEFDNIIKPLPFYFNTQVNASSLLLISNALILHLFYGSNKTKNIVNILSKYSDELYLRVKRQKNLSDYDRREIIGWKNILYPEIEKQCVMERKILYILFKAFMQGDFVDTVKSYCAKLIRKVSNKVQ